MPTSAGNSIAQTPTMYNTGHKMNNDNTVCATKALPLINIKENKILMPSHSTNLKIHLPDQKAVIESLKSGQWPPPHLANIKNHTIALVNNLNQPVILTEEGHLNQDHTSSGHRHTPDITHTISTQPHQTCRETYGCKDHRPH